MDSSQQTRLRLTQWWKGTTLKREKRLTVEPDKYLAPLNQPRLGRKLKRVDQLWPKAGRLLVAERLRLNTARVVALSTERPVLSNVWWPLKTDDHKWEKALAVYLNCSMGLLALLATRNTTQGNWVKLKKADLKEMPVLDPSRLSSSQLQALSRLFRQPSHSRIRASPRHGALPGPSSPGRWHHQDTRPPRPQHPPRPPRLRTRHLQPASIGHLFSRKYVHE